jgi:two-component system KDP operon response regulator KdpE
VSPGRTTVLVVDDEQSLLHFIRRNLEVRNFEVLTAANGLEGLALFGTEQVDLVIVDLMMPHMNGLEMIRRIRQQSLLPIIVLSALGEEQDKVQALNQGADDYLTKPFGVDELLARLQAVLRRTQWNRSAEPEGERLVCDDLVVDPQRHTATLGGKPLELTPTEFELLVLLMSQAGKVLPHKLILQRVWGPEYGQETEYLRVYIGRLRQKVEPDPGNPRYLLTERGIRYRFNHP